MKQINSKISQLAQTTHGLNEKKQKDDKISASTDVGKTSLSAAQDVIQAKRYIVYLHYMNKKNKKLMERLSAFLNNCGFKVAGIQRVNYHNQDVRYFHDEDKEGALVLKKQLSGFITPITDLKDTNIKIINLSSKFPNAQKGALELWVNFLTS